MSKVQLNVQISRDLQKRIRIFSIENEINWSLLAEDVFEKVITGKIKVDLSAFKNVRRSGPSRFRELIYAELRCKEQSDKEIAAKVGCAWQTVQHFRKKFQED